MVRTLTPARAAKGQRSMLLPGATEAEGWEVWTTGPDGRCLQAGRTLQEISPGRETTLALPVAQVMALPLWLQETDAKLLEGMIELQLEARSLQPRGREAVFDWAIVAQEEARTLVIVGVLASILPEDLETDAYPAFELSARCFALPSDALVLWTEQDRLTLAITRGDRLAYFHTLAEPRFTDRVLQDLTCIVAALQMQEVIGALQRLVLWTEATPGEITQLQSVLGLPVRQETRPVPTLPGEPWNLTPARVGAVKRQREARRWQGRAAALAVLLLLAAGLAFGARLFLAYREVGQLRQWQADHASSLQMVHDTQAAWQDLRPVVDTSSYPLEVLLHISESLPGDQVHLTLFEADGDHLLLKAEAKNLTAAFTFFDQLKKNSHLKAYTWDMAQPESMANDVTQLQIEGTHATHN